jgi:proteasome alpha subunit
MTMPFYVSPEQVMQDKAEYARKGIGRGKSSITLEYDSGILLMAENPSSLSKIGEIYDRIAFAVVGKFSEFDQLRKVGVRYADVKGYAYSRDDVRARALAMPTPGHGDVFTRELKPLRGRGDRRRGRRPGARRPRAQHHLPHPVRRQHLGLRGSA